MNFWEWLVHTGLIIGDPNYYASGAAEPFEFTHALQTAMQGLETASDPTAKQMFWQRLQETGAIQGDPTYYSSGAAEPFEFTHALTVASEFFAGGGGTGGGGGDAGIPLHILASPSLKWFKDASTGRFYAQYNLPGGAGTVLFEAEPEQISALFPSGSPPGVSTFNFNAELGKDGVHFGGNVSEVEGEGSWESEVERTIALALNQQSLPDWIKNDAQARDLLWVAVTEDRTDEWFYSQVSKTASFKTRYPGVASLTGKGLSVVEAVKAHTQFETQLKTLHAAAGFTPDAITPAIVGQLLTKGYSAQAVQESYSVWKRMNDHAPALAAFNNVLAANGQAPLTGASLYDFLQGNAPSEIYDIYEAAAINEAAVAAGFGGLFTAEDALSLALETTRDLTVDQAYEQFSQVAMQALRFRHELDIGQFGLDVEDLIDVSFGRAPRSGKNIADIGENLARAAASAEASLNSKAKPFVGFTPDGRPMAQSLGGLRQQQ